MQQPSEMHTLEMQRERSYCMRSEDSVVCAPLGMSFNEHVRAGQDQLWCERGALPHVLAVAAAAQRAVRLRQLSRVQLAASGGLDGMTAAIRPHACCVARWCLRIVFVLDGTENDTQRIAEE